MAASNLPPGDDYLRLGGALRELRRRAGLTQREAGGRVGVRSEFISKVERGNCGMRWHTSLTVLGAYDVDCVSSQTRSSATADLRRRQGLSDWVCVRMNVKSRSVSCLCW
jgi:DNA-binding XRE family transcriptional regulator